MAIIYSYPVSTPHLEDLLIGTVTFNELDPLSPRNNPTVSFTVQSLVDMISPIVGGQTLQSVTTFGATTTIPVSFFGGISVSGPFKDINNNAGSNTQILSSTGTSVKWIDNNPVTANDFLTALTFNTNDGVLTGTVSNQSNVTVDLDGRYLQGNETITLSGDVTGTGTTAITTTLATVNTDIGAFTNANITVNAKGLVTAASSGTPNTNWYVTGGSFDTSNGDLSITGNNVAVGATIDLDGRYMSSLTTTGTTGESTFNAATGILNVPNYTFTEADTLATVTGRGATTATASTFSGGLTSSGVLTSSGTGANAYTYFTGNAYTGTADEPPSNTFRNGMAQAWNNSGGSAEWESFWATGSSLTNDATGQANNAASYISGYNRFAPGTTTPIDTRMYKWYGNGELELQNMSIAGNTLPGGGATPTISNPNWRMPITDAPNTGYVLAKSSGSINLEWVQSASSATGTPNSTNYLRGDNTWASIPSGLNYEGIWEAGTIGETNATISSDTITLVTAPSQTLVTGMRVTGTGITVGATVLISSVTSQTEVVVDTSVSIASGVQVTFSPEGGFPDLTVAANKGDGVLRICTIQGFASPNGFGVAPSFWNVGDWCVFSGTVGGGAWTRIPATNAGVTSFTSDFTFPGAGSPPQFIGGNTLSGVSGAVDIGRINLSATAVSGNIDSGKYLRGDNKWDLRITEVQGTSGLTGGSANGGSIAISPQYDTEGNIILSSYSGDTSITTTAGSGGSTTLTFSTINAAKIFAGMQVLQIGAAAWVVSSVNYSSGVVTFVGNVTPDPGVNATVDFTAVLTGTSQMIFNAGTGASISEFVSHKAISTVGLSLFLNDAGFLTSGVTSITGKEPITVVTTGGPTAATPRIDLRYADSSAAADDNVVTACPEGEGTIILTGSDTLLINDATEGSAPAVLNVVREFSLDRLKAFMAAGDITGVTAGSGLSGGGPSGDVTLNVEYDTDGNVILESFSGDFIAVTTVGGATTQTQLQFSAANIAKIKPGMVAGTTALGTEIGTVSSSTGTTVTFTANLGVTIGTGANVNFSSVITSSSQLMFNAGTGASISEFVSHKALSTVDLGLFNNDQGWNTAAGTLTGVTGAEPLYSVTTGTGTPTVPQIKLRYDEDTAGNNDSIITAAPAFGAGTADPGDLIIISDQSTSLNETKKIALSQLGFATSSGSITEIIAGDGLTGGGTVSPVTVSAMYTGTDNIILDATVSTNIEASSKMMISYDNSEGSIPVVNQMSLSDVALSLFNNDIGGGGTVTSVAALTLGTTGTDLSSTVAGGSGAAVITLQVPSASAANRGALTAADWATFNGKTSNTGTVTSVAANTGLTGGTITSSGTLKVQYTGGASVIMAAFANGVSFSDSDEFIRSTGSSGTASVERDTLGDLKAYIASGAPSGTVTSVGSGNGLTGGAITSSGTLAIDYTNSTTNLINSALVSAITVPVADSILILKTTGSPSAIGSVQQTPISKLPFTNNTGTVTGVTATAPITSSGGTAPLIAIPVASGTANGYLSSGNWTTFNNKTSNTGTVTGVTGTSPVASSGGTAPAISMAKATASVDGYLSSTDWSTFNNKTSNTGTVTSITLAAGSGTGTAVTTSGTFTFTAGTNVTTSVTGTTVTINSTDQYVGTVTGTGTANYVSKWSTGSNQVNSVLRDDGTGVAIGNTPDASYRMLIEGAVSGYKHIGTGNGDVGFYTKNQGTATANILYQADANIGGTNTTVFTVISSGTLEVKGDVIAYGSPSDIRLKENIKPIESALDKAMKLQGVTFDWKEKDGKILDLKEDIGFIAQDVQKVIPELVRENEDGMLSMRHQGIAPILLEAIKELKQEIEELKLNKCNCKCN